MKIYFTAFLLLFFCAGVLAQNTVSGKVLDNNGEGLPGAVVQEQGTNNGVITNVDGGFELTVSPDANLVVTFLGFESQTIEVGNQTNIQFNLKQDLKTLEEVVVVGYGTQKKSDVTGSVASISSEVLESRPSLVSLEQMLQGTVAGLNINVNSSNAEGSSNSILIRGAKSINAGNEPLIVLDGIPYQGGLSELNPRDVSSIEVLKDASASAIYGARGANGVILITSKKGKEGKLSVNYTGTYAFDQIVNVPDLMDGSTFYESKVARGEGTTLIEDEAYRVGRNTDWVDIATQTGIQQQHNLSFSGGNKKTTFYLSLARTNSEGVAIGDEFARTTFRVNLGHKIIPWITFNTNTQLAHYDRSGNDADFERAFEMNPLGIPYEEDGSIRMLTWEDEIYGANPLLDLLNVNSNITRRIITNNSLTFDFPFLKGLSYKLNSGYDFRSALVQTYQGRNTRDGSRVGGSLDISNAYDEDWLLEHILSYKQDFGKHSIFLTALYSAQSEWAEDHDFHGEGFPNDTRTYYQISSASLVEPSSSYNLRTHVSQMFRANYTYDGRYLFTFTTRRDGYSAFGEDTKYGVFPSVAVGWNIANESFMQGISIFNSLKLRASYGLSGNEAVGAYQTLPTLSDREYVDGNDGTLFGFFPNNIGDPSLGWESTTSLNTGLDFDMFDGRIRGTIDTYWSQTTDLLLARSISPVNGFTSITQNRGETSNNGIEFQISTINVQNNDFTWSTNFNIAHYDTKIVNVDLTDENGDFIDDVGSRWFIGEPIDVNFNYVIDGIYQEDLDETPQGAVEAGDIRYLDSDGDGTITDNDREIIGRRIPDFTSGITNTLTYKNFTLSFFINAVFGITKSNELLSTNDLDYRQNRYNVDFWTPENLSNEYPRNAANTQVNPLGVPFYQSADFVRLQNISLSYALPTSLLSRFNIQSLEVFTNMRNVSTWTDWVGLDPEFNDQTAVPQTTTYLFGVKLGL